MGFYWIILLVVIAMVGCNKAPIDITGDGADKHRRTNQNVPEWEELLSKSEVKKYMKIMNK